MKQKALPMLLALSLAAAVLAVARPAVAAEYVVYSVYRGLDLGEAAQPPQKDFYVNMGSSQGVRRGAVLDVFRKSSTYDLMNEKLYKEVTFPIARLRVIHVEANAAIARLEKMLPADETPSYSPAGVMIGDKVEIAR